MESRSGAIFEFSCNKFKTRRLVLAASDLSSSGPSGATFFWPSFPTKPDMRDVVSHADASNCQRAAAF